MKSRVTTFFPFLIDNSNFSSEESEFKSIETNLLKIYFPFSYLQTMQTPVIENVPCKFKIQYAKVGNGIFIKFF